jgi:hypothetical protein
MKIKAPFYLMGWQKFPRYVFQRCGVYSLRLNNQAYLTDTLILPMQLEDATACAKAIEKRRIKGLKRLQDPTAAEPKGDKNGQALSLADGRDEQSLRPVDEPEESR